MSDRYCLECGSPLLGLVTGGICSICALRGALAAGVETGPPETSREAGEPDAGRLFLAPGHKFDDYEILEEIGRGGMGVVYRAKDMKLDRGVAIKVLTEEFAKDADRVARFRREAKLLASLNHPNIAAIYGLEKSGETNFLVLELVEGETLAHQLRNGAIPVEKSIKLALQIAAALEAAHEKGVIHRDLKPANIKVTPDGKIKVLDFGLAKAFAGEQTELNLTNSPTLSLAATQQGAILGTAAYMSPEQAKGKLVDKRTDIWAFGCVLYEMLTGRTAIHGDDISEILASVIKGDVNLDLLPTDTNRDLPKLLNRCLQKDLKKRYQDIGDVRFDLEQLLADNSPSVPAPEAGMRRIWPFVLPWVAGAVIITAIIAGLAVWRLKPREPRPVARFSCVLPADQTLMAGTGARLAISPDGSRFVCATFGGLYLRSIDQLKGGIIPGTESQDSAPFFSPDGQWVGFWSQRDKQLKKIPISGGQPVTICDATGVFGVARWSAQNIIWFDDSNGRFIMRVSADGGIPEKIFENKTEYRLYSPQLLPDGKALLLTYTPSGRPLNMKVVVQSLGSGSRKELFEGAGVQYLDTGHLVYGNGRGALSAVPFDAGRLQVTGGPVPLVQDVEGYAVSNSGALVYMPRAASSAERTLVWVDRNGKEEVIDSPRRAYMHAHLSPDGRRIALDIRDEENDIWIWDLAHRTMVRLTSDPGMNRGGVWTPDGEKLAYSADRNGAENIWLQSVNGSGDPEPLTKMPEINFFPHSFTPDGKQLLITQTYTPTDVILVSIGSSAAPKILLGSKFNETEPQISPDGHWMAYMSDESGRSEIYVRPFPDVNTRRWQISTEGGTRPEWNKNGREIFYIQPHGIMMSVPVETGASFKAGQSRILFKGEYQEFSSVTPDGLRFLMIKDADLKPADAAPPQQINVVLNWIEELKQRVPNK
jgi:eukaryotic-like serine/threonine-protein kinase